MHRSPPMSPPGADSERTPRGVRPPRRRRAGRRVSRWLAFLTVLAALLTAGASAHAASGPAYFGTNLQTLGLLPEAKWDRAFQALADGQLTIERFEVRWDDLEPDAPVDGAHTYVWGATDALMADLAEHGLRAAPLFRFSPSWAQVPNPALPGRVDVLPPSSYDDYASLIVAFARRYGPSGTFWASHPQYVPQPTLTYEVWNEANLDQYAWNQRADAAAYSAVLTAVRPKLKAVQPQAALVGSLAWQTDGPGVAPNFVEQLRAAGGLAQLDAVGFHPYAPDAQSTLDLVRSLRARLAAAGFPDLPIYANEAGQPVVLSGPGAQYAFAGRPSDAARASSVAFAGEALAASDCGVEQFMIYTIVGSETELEPIGEGFMGMLRLRDASPNLTGQALQRASGRWADRFGPGGPGRPAPLHLCQPGVSPDASLLPIAATFTSTASGCVSVQASYDGNPLESAVLRFVDPATGSEVASARTDAFGAAGQCIPEPLRGQPFQVVAEIAGAGRSAVVRCDVPGVGCPVGAVYSGSAGVISALQRGGQPAPVQLAGPAPCTWALDASALRPERLRGGLARVTVRMRLRCGARSFPQATPRVRFALALQRAGRRSQQRLRVVWLRPGERRTVQVRIVVGRGDSLALVHREDASSGVLRLRRQLRLRTPVGG